MVAHALDYHITPQEYLKLERNAAFRSEYDNGTIVSMAGASIEHNRIVFDTVRLLGNQLEGKHCEGFALDMRVRIPDCNKYDYPDLIVACGEPHSEDSEADSLLNPKLIIEVLSESTEKVDRTSKFDCYDTLESLTDYVLISQSEPRIEHYSRLQGGVWSYMAARNTEDTLELPSIECILPLAKVYARISFPPSSVEQIN